MLVGKPRSHDPSQLPDETILVARNLGAADLLEYDRRKLRGIVLEEGSKTAHVTIVARAIGIPMLGRIEGAMAAIDPGNPVALDGDNGHLYVRPNDEILQAFQQRDARPGRAAPLFRRDPRAARGHAGRHPDHAVDQRRLPDRSGRASRRSAPRAAACSAPSSRS